MIRHFFRFVAGSTVALMLSGLLLLPGQHVGSIAGSSPAPKSVPVVKVAPAVVALASPLLREGMRLVKWEALLETVVQAMYAVGTGAPREEVIKTLVDGMNKQLEDIKERQDAQRNEILQQQLKVMGGAV